MPATRLRQVRVRWREGFDDREFAYNDRPLERRWADEGVEEGLLAAGWTMESSEERGGNWERVYILRETEPEGAAPLYELVFVTNPKVIGPPAKEYRAAVAVQGEWAVCSAPFGDSVAEVYRLGPDGWKGHARLRSKWAAGLDWLPAIRFHGEELLIATPLDGAVLRFGPGFVQLESLRSELNNYGQAVAADGEWTAVTGWEGKRPVTVFRRAGTGPQEVETRIVGSEAEEERVVSLSGEWSTLGTGDRIHLYRNGMGGWTFHSTVPGAAARVLGDRMVAVSRGARAEATWYRLREGRWEAEATLALGNWTGEAVLEWEGETVAIGFPYCFGATGAVVLVTEREGLWEVAQTIQAPEGRLGERFGEALSMSGEHLMIGAQGAVAGGGCGYIYRRVR